MKSFKQFITETPFVDFSLKKASFKDMSKDFTDEFSKLHKNSDKIADTDIGSIHKVNLHGMHGYYHHVNGKPREYSLVTQSNIQRQVDKNGGSGLYIKQIMKHHANTYGELKSDDEQSVGGTKLWKSLYHEKDPNFSFHHYERQGEDSSGKELHIKHKIDDEYLKNNENTIWNTNKDEGKKHRIGMTPNA